MDASNAQTVEELIDFFSSQLLISPYDVKALTLRGMLLESQSRYKLAIADFNTLIDTGEKKGYYLRAYSYCRIGKIDLALNDFGKVDIQGIQSTAILPTIAYIAKKRNEIIKEIEAEYFREKLMEKYNTVNFILPN